MQDGPEPVSHGICLPCVAQEMKKLHEFGSLTEPAGQVEDAFMRRDSATEVS